MVFRSFANSFLSLSATYFSVFLTICTMQRWYSVIGKAAAAIMAIGGVKKVHTGVISESAYDLLVRSGIEISFDKKVAYIINRTQTDRCPLEKLCADASTPQECIPLIDAFIKKQKKLLHV